MVISMENDYTNLCEDDGYGSAVVIYNIRQSKFVCIEIRDATEH
jgi:hypothetical protein